MVTKVQKWGNSQGLRITPVRRVRGRTSLEDLVARIPEDYDASEVDWGKPVGKEAW